MVTCLVRCLCLILTLWMAGSARPAISRTVESDPWWGTKEAVEVRKSADAFRADGNFAGVEAVDRRAYEFAVRRHDDRAAFVYLTGVGAARLVQHKYRPALDALLGARDLALRVADPVALGAVAINLSSLYLQVWDIDSAVRIAEEGLTRSESISAAYVRLPLLLQLGRLHQMQGDDRAAKYFAQAIEQARTQGDVAQEARGWDQLAEERLRSGKTELADRDACEAFRLRRQGARGDLAFSYARLGAVKLAQGEWENAGRFTDRAIKASPSGVPGLPLYLLLHQRGEIRLRQGDTPGALREFSSAIDQAGLWRQGALPARSSLVAANVELEERIFRSYTQTAAAEALRTGDPYLAAESFEAAELNRASSLRDGLAVADAWRRKLPVEYWQILAQLRSTQNLPGAARLESSLTELEARAGLNSSPNKIENFRGRTSLTHFQHGLSNSELFLSLYLGETHSYLWVVTRETLSLHRLPGAGEIRSSIAKFRDIVRREGSDGGQMGKQLYTALFGELSAEEAAKREWLLSLDDALFELPFAALVTERGDGKMEYLVEHHSVQVVPGALALIVQDLTSASRVSRGEADGGNRQAVEPGWFLGVGDPIYNTADPRWSAEGRRNRPLANQFKGWFAFGKESTTFQLSRLVGSGKEVASSARNWAIESGTDLRLLTGADARRDRFLHLVAERPAIIHLATHILAAPQRKVDEMLAFGLDGAGQIEPLSGAEVAMLDVAGAVVSMTGCASGAGEIQAGAGLLGLTRAWELAGARAVIATGWPVGDTSGELFDAFYRNLRSVSPAEALRRSQVEMIHSGTWRSAPAYWAAFQSSGRASGTVSGRGSGTVSGRAADGPQ